MMGAEFPQAARQRSTRKHLPKEAYDILNDYFYDITRWPTERAREELAERVRAIPGGQHYTAAHVYRYFANLKSRLKRNGVAGPSRIDTQGPSKVAMLEVLLKDDPNPSPEVAEIWAERLGGGVTVEQVITYAFLHPRRSAQREGDHSPTQGRSPQSVEPPASAASDSSTLLPESPESSPGDPPLSAAAVPDVPRGPRDDRDLPRVSEVPESPKIMPVSKESPQLQTGTLRSADELESTVNVDPLELAMRLHSALSSTYPPADSSTPRCPRSFAELARWLGEQQNMTMEL